MLSKLIVIAGALVALGLLSVVSPDAGWAQAYPDRPIRLVVPFGAGGITDQTARVMGEELGRILKQNVVVENRAGASGALAASQVARSAPDGYTLLLLTNGVAAVNPLLQDKISYNALDDFDFVSMVALTPQVFVTDPKGRFGTLAELVAAAKDAPETLPFSSAGIGSSIHQGMLLLRKDAGVAFLHVPFRSGAEAMTAILNGSAVASAIEAVIAEPLIRSGTLRALALTARERIAILPEVPTVKEAIGVELEAGSLSGIVAPKGTPPDILALLERATKAATEGDLARDRIFSQGSQRLPPGSAAFRDTIRQEVEKWRAIFRAGP